MENKNGLGKMDIGDEWKRFEESCFVWVERVDVFGFHVDMKYG